MTQTAQEWLETIYPHFNTKVIYVGGIAEHSKVLKDLTGGLDFSKYTQLEVLDIKKTYELISIDISGCSKLKMLYFGVNKFRSINWPTSLNDLQSLTILRNTIPAQEPRFLEKMPNLEYLCIGRNSFVNYNPYLSKCPNLKELTIRENSKLEGLIQIKDLLYLKKLDLGINRVSDLQLINLPSLNTLDCSKNQLTNLDFLKQLSNPEVLLSLDISNNKLTNQDLTCFSSLVNLSSLNLQNSGLSGSLLPLKGLTKLNEINVSSTRLNSDIENLPNNLNTINADKMPNFHEKLKGHFNVYGLYDYQRWLKANSFIVNEDNEHNDTVMQMSEEESLHFLIQDLTNQMIIANESFEDLYQNLYDSLSMKLNESDTIGLLFDNSIGVNIAEFLEEEIYDHDSLIELLKNTNPKYAQFIGWVRECDAVDNLFDLSIRYNQRKGYAQQLNNLKSKLNDLQETHVSDISMDISDHSSFEEYDSQFAEYQSHQQQPPK